MESNRRDGIEVPQPAAFPDRLELARACCERLGLTVPLLLDTMENDADRAFSAWPERLFVVDRGGCVLYHGGKGPYGFDPDELGGFLASQLRASNA